MGRPRVLTDDQRRRNRNECLKAWRAKNRQKLRDQARERMSDPEYREKVIAYRQKARSNPEYREKERLANQKRREANPPDRNKKRERDRAYYERNKDERKRKAREYSARNRAIVVRKAAERIAAHNSAIQNIRKGPWTKEEENVLMSGISVADASFILSRTYSAVVARRKMLKKAHAS